MEYSSNIAEAFVQIEVVFLLVFWMLRRPCVKWSYFLLELLDSWKFEAMWIFQNHLWAYSYFLILKHMHFKPRRRIPAPRFLKDLWVRLQVCCIFVSCAQYAAGERVIHIIIRIFICNNTIKKLEENSILGVSSTKIVINEYCI